MHYLKKINGTSQYNIKSVKLQGHQSVHLGNTTDCESVLTFLTVKGAMKSQKHWFCIWWQHTNALTLFFLTDSSQVFCFPKCPCHYW